MEHFGFEKDAQFAHKITCFHNILKSAFAHQPVNNKKCQTQLLQHQAQLVLASHSVPFLHSVVKKTLAFYDLSCTHCTLGPVLRFLTRAITGQAKLCALFDGFCYFRRGRSTKTQLRMQIKSLVVKLSRSSQFMVKYASQMTLTKILLCTLCCIFERFVALSNGCFVCGF